MTPHRRASRTSHGVEHWTMAPLSVHTIRVGPNFVADGT